MAREGKIESVTCGDEAFCSKEYEKAIKFYSTALLRDGICNNEEILQKRSQSYFELEKYNDSLTDAMEVVKMNQESVLGVLLSAKNLSKLKRYDEALIMYQKGLKFNPNNKQIEDRLKDMKSKVLESSEKTSESQNEDYNALDICSQNTYPGDEELLNAEGEILEKVILKDVCEVCEAFCKIDPKMVIEYVENGRICKLNGEYLKALEYFKNVANDNPQNMSILQEIAEIYYTMNDYNQAYHYCSRIPAVLRSYVIWTLGGKILDKLNLPVTSESWLRQANGCPKQNNDAALLFQQVRVKRIFGPITEKLPLDVVFSEHGRSLQATAEINSKSVIFKDSPVVISQTIDTLDIPACSQCARSLLSAEQYFGRDLISGNNKLQRAIEKYWPKREIFHCKKCEYEKYCSEDCQTKAWQNHHRIICPSVNKNAQKLYAFSNSFGKLPPGSHKYLEGVWNASFSPLLLARIWASIICSADLVAKERGTRVPSKMDYDIAKAEFRRFIAFGRTSNAKQIPKMVEIMRSVFQNLENGSTYEITEREFDGRYFQAACNVQAFSDSEDPYKVFSKQVKSRPALKDLIPFIKQEPKEANFAGLFTLHACMNHSCGNNALVLDGEVCGKPGVCVSARKHINPGDELFTTYINPEMSRKERRTALYRAYNFWCQCERCNFEGDNSSSCTNCGRETVSEKQFPACGRCRKAWYCSTKCQKTAWKKGHKKICSG